MYIETFENHQFFDLNGLKGRLMSSSYCPRPQDPLFDDMMCVLHTSASSKTTNMSPDVLADLRQAIHFSGK